MLWILKSLAILLLSPHLFTHDLSLLIVPCALFLSTGKQLVPLGVAMGLLLIAMLPAINHLVPTIMAAALAISFLLALILLRAKFAQPGRVIASDTVAE
jgi:hypothetical protein